MSQKGQLVVLPNIMPNDSAKQKGLFYMAKWSFLGQSATVAARNISYLKGKKYVLHSLTSLSL